MFIRTVKSNILVVSSRFNCVKFSVRSGVFSTRDLKRIANECQVCTSVLFSKSFVKGKLFRPVGNPLDLVTQFNI